MKILELDLLAFGPFTDTKLDLSGGREGLHLIHGPNEAGKTSALRGLRNALFGFPLRTPDAFLHPYAKLRIGMTLRASDGKTLRFVRRKGAKGNTLQAANGGRGLSENDLARMLNGLSEPEFSSRFAIDHHDLIQGGQSILSERGELGAVLFQAAGGLRNLVQVRQELAEELTALYKTGGSKPRINALLSNLKEENDRKRTASIKGAEWLEHDRNLKDAEARLERLSRTLAETQAAKSRLERLDQARPLLSRRRDAEEQLAGLGDVILLSESFRDTRFQAQSRRDAARREADQARERIAAIDRRLDELVVPEKLLAEAPAIDELHERLGTANTARKALQAEEASFVQAMTLATEFLAEFRPDLLEAGAETATDLGPWRSAGAWRTLQDRDAALDRLTVAANRLRQTQSRKNQVRQLADEGSQLETELSGFRKRAADLTRKLDLERAELDRLPAAIDASALDQALRSARNQGDLDSEIDAAEARLAQTESRAADALKRLPLWTGTLEAITSARVVSQETIERFEAEFGRLDADRAQLRADRRGYEERKTEAEATLEQIRQVDGALPTEDDLKQARDERDALWRVIRRAWESGEPPSAKEKEEITPKAFEQRLEGADSIVDRLRREASRVAQQAEARSRLVIAGRELDRITEQEQALARRAEAVEAEWRAAWADQEITPLSPREMRGWLGRYNDLVKLTDDLATHRRDVQKLTSRRDEHRDRLRQCLEALGEPPCPSGGTLAEDRDRAEELLRRLTAVEAQRTKLRDLKDQHERERNDANVDCEEAERRLADWRRRWAEMMASLDLPAETSREEAQEVGEQAARLQAHLKDARESRDRLARHDEELAEFARLFRELCGRIDFTQKNESGRFTEATDAAARELMKRYDGAVAARKERDDLLARREAEHSRLISHENVIKAAESELGQLCQEARCESEADLPDAERRSREAREVRGKIDQLDEQIETLRGLESPDAFRQEALAADPDRLPGEIDKLAAEIQSLAAELAEQNQNVGRHQESLRRMDGTSVAATAAENAEELKARLAFEVEEYARGWLALEVLRQAIDRYREQSQGPVVARASALFRELTLGSFEGLDVETNDRDEPILRGVRPGGDPVGVEAMSLGTADQLYLALRLASLETYLDRHEPIPLIVDDILIQFDDERSAAALGVLAELSRKTQVVMFTHHEHLCRLATERIDPALLFVTHLPGRSHATAPARSGSG